jgi:hypothetical protein
MQAESGDTGAAEYHRQPAAGCPTSLGITSVTDQEVIMLTNKSKVLANVWHHHYVSNSLLPMQEADTG